MTDALVLSLADAHFSFHGSDALALAGIDLQVRRGETVAVLGPLGAGTSTLCRLAAGLLGERGTRSGSVEVQGSVAMLGEDPEAQLTGMTSYVDDEVRLPARLSGSARPVDVDAALDAFGMQRLLGRRLDTLSGGERQLVALAGLMTLGPSLLVLDQPALSLDPDARRLLSASLRRFCDEGGAVLLAGHQHDELTAAADRVAFVQGGRLVAVARSAELTDAVLDAHGVWNTVGGPAAPEPEPRSERVPVPESEPRRREKRLDVSALTVHRGRSAVFEALDCSAAPGEIVAIVGANGTGKSTLLRAIAGMLEPPARVGGAVRVDHQDLQGLPAHQRARWIGWVGQDPGAQLSSATVRVELERALPLPTRRRDRPRARAERAEAVARVLAQTGLTEHADAHPYDLDPAQRKDLVIASALLLDAGVLLLDEPTLARDLRAMRRLERVVHDFSAHGGTVVSTTHDLRWAGRIATRTLRLG